MNIQYRKPLMFQGILVLSAISANLYEVWWLGLILAAISGCVLARVGELEFADNSIYLLGKPFALSGIMAFLSVFIIAWSLRIVGDKGGAWWLAWIGLSALCSLSVLWICSQVLKQYRRPKGLWRRTRA